MDSNIRYIFGSICVLILSGTVGFFCNCVTPPSFWIVTTLAVQNVNDHHYIKPVFMWWFSHSVYIMFVIPWLLISCRDGNGCTYYKPATRTWRKVLSLGLIQAIIVMFSTLTWFLSLGMTSISGNTAVYNTSPAFVFVLSVIFLEERITVMKSIAVCCSVGGGILIGVSASNEGGPRDSPWGYALVFVSVVLYALFQVFYKGYCHEEDDPKPISTTIMYTFLLGLFNILVLWIILPLCHVAKIERFELPPDSISWLRFLFVGIAEMGFQAFLFIGIALSSPLFISVGTTISIPLSLLVDYFVNGILLQWSAFIGVGFILVGFFTLSYTHYTEMRASQYSSLHDLKDVSAAAGSVTASSSPTSVVRIGSDAGESSPDEEDSLIRRV